MPPKPYPPRASASPLPSLASTSLTRSPSLMHASLLSFSSLMPPPWFAGLYLFHARVGLASLGLHHLSDPEACPSSPVVSRSKVKEIFFLKFFKPPHRRHHLEQDRRQHHPLPDFLDHRCSTFFAKPIQYLSRIHAWVADGGCWRSGWFLKVDRQRFGQDGGGGGGNLLRAPAPDDAGARPVRSCSTLPDDKDMKEVVIKVQMNNDKCRRKAMKLAASADGVDSVKIDGEDKNQLVVVGEGVDPVILTGILRKKIGYSDIVKVEEKKKDDEEKKSEEPKIEPIAWYHYTPGPPVVVQDMGYHSNPGGCSIM